jgi:hypothetical protein
MPFTLKEENIKNALTATALRYGGLLNYAWTIHTANLLARILLVGGMFQNLVQRYYFIGNTPSHLILQLSSSFYKPKGEPIVCPWNNIRILEIKKVAFAKMVVFKLENEKKFRLRILDSQKQIANYETHRDAFINKFNSLLKPA